MDSYMHEQRYQTLNHRCTFGPDLALVQTSPFETPEFSINHMSSNTDMIFIHAGSKKHVSHHEQH